MKADTKRQNFNVTPEQEAKVAWLQEHLDAASAKEVFLKSVDVVSMLVREAVAGSDLYFRSMDGQLTRLLMPELARKNDWRYLTDRPHAWRRQLYVKGRRLLASTVWGDMLANGMTPAEVADDWDLPLEAVDEIIRYCELNRALIKMEAEEERSRLIASGVRLAA